MTAEEWTLDELIGMVAERLGDTAYAGAPNGRVRDVPDARAVRWYTTIGLVDRPVMRGRTAWYGPRHLTQLVAIKRRQSQGFKIAEIQAELAEAPDEVLTRIAELPEIRTDVRFWARPPAEYVRPSGPRGGDGAGGGHGGASAPPPAPPELPAPPAARQAPPAGPAASSAPPGVPTGPIPRGLLSGVPLGGGAVLLLHTTPTEGDLEAIRDAARELMDLLATRGLLTPGETTRGPFTPDETARGLLTPGETSRG